MRVIVAGSRSWYCPGLAELVVGRLMSRHGTGLVIVHGGAEGVDLALVGAAEDVGPENLFYLSPSPAPVAAWTVTADRTTR